MKLSLALSALVASATVMPIVAGEGPRLAFDETPCILRYGSLDQVELSDCTGGMIRGAIKEAFDGNVASQCEWDVNYELRLITRTLSFDKAILHLDNVCDEAQVELFRHAPRSDWTDIDGQFTDTFMDEYTDGGTFLNHMTGNFKNGNGSDPRENKNYPTDDESYFVGQSIDEFYSNGDATETVLGRIDHLSECKHQAIMCCFGRDRQYGDGNGNCARSDCDDASPADNSNICFYDADGGAPTKYKGDEEVHCHGLAWGDDDDDASFQLRFNNFFYVLMHDHMYRRGYVEQAIPEAPMCSCVENMPKVSRADCSQVRMLSPYTLSLLPDGSVEVHPTQLEFKFQQCQGYKLNMNGNIVDNQANNDLASHVNKLWYNGQMSDATRDSIFDTLVGNRAPDNNTNENACEAAWVATTGTAY